ncbi:MAG: hypothetical protein KatS3mg042_1643 [Rhodothermaceae bacterium]|nr:MAG: hypothetical protein KatS3mg042_1643 [Rhodothermaceae bacterium]
MKHVYSRMMTVMLVSLLMAATAAAQVPQVRMDGPLYKMSRHLAMQARAQAAASYVLTSYTVEFYEQGVWTEFESGERTYDDQGRLIEEMIVGLDIFSFPPMQVQWRVSYTYDGSGRLTEVLVELEDQGSFMPLTRSVYTYDGTTLQSITEESYDPNTGTFVPTSRTTNVAYQGNIAVETITESYDGTNWVNDTRQTIVEEGGNVVFTEQVWDGSAWMNDSRTIAENVSLADIDATVFAQLEGEFGQGAGLYSSVVLLYASFDPNVWFGRFTVVLDQSWDGSAWIDNRRTTITRDAQNRVVELLDELCDEFGCFNESRQTFSYDASGRVATWDTEDWDLGLSAWTLVTRQTHTYDSNGNVMMVLQEVPDESGNGLEPTVRISYTWSDQGSVHTESGPESVAFDFTLDGPNPFAEHTALRFTLEAPAYAAVRLFDLLGREITTLVQGTLPAGTHQVAVEGADLPAGLYLVRLQANGRSATRLLTRIR